MNHEPIRTGNEWVEVFCYLNRCLRDLKRDLRQSALVEKVSPNEALVLLCCQSLSQEGIPQKRLVEFIGVSAAQVSATVESLQSKGFVESHRPTHDRRNQVWRLLAPGVKVVDRLVNQLRHERRDSFDSDRIKSLKQIFDSLPTDLSTIPSQRGAA